TIGMAVDANVLIFERIREELHAGKTPWAAVDSGYSKAFSAIFDSNLSSIIAAAVLFQFGTGPVRGFAVTLTIGLLANLFTAVFVTRIVYDYFVFVRKVKTISI
ncbi:MAG TPA: MMPL family transporter, partial [Thermodesulfobacteriota bacterium]|nr:MMPL family transporter [Thermodesulfobacteriota bacterium]